MRRIAFLVFLIGLASAQFEDTEGKLSQCQENCCIVSGGAWDAALQDCSVSGPGFNDYYNCESSCLEIAGRELESRGAGLNLCCAPAFIFAGLAAMVTTRSRCPN
ncbi:MAG: hypothetical protein V1861_05385 [Candidatus Micrarchaeota archaeon]